MVRSFGSKLPRTSRVDFAVLGVAILCAMLTSRAEAEWKPLIIRSAAEVAQGITGGEGHQHIRGMDRSVTEPDLIYLGIDVAGTWRSEDGGRNWIKNLDRGLFSFNIQSLAVDPENSHRLFVLAAVPTWSSDFVSESTGLYKSEDKGQNWDKVADIPFVYKHANYQLIYRRIISPLKKPDGRRVWYAAADEGAIYRSGDNGETWRLWAPRPTEGENHAYYTLVPGTTPEGKETVLVGSTDGLFRYTDDNQDERVEASEIAKLPVPGSTASSASVASASISGILMHPDKPGDIVAVQLHGTTYRTVNGGLAPGDWEEVEPGGTYDKMTRLIGRILDKNTDIKAINGFQDPFRPQNRWLITTRGLYRATYSGHDMGWDAVPQSDFETTPYLLESITTKINDTHSAIVFHPNDREDMVSFTYIPWRFDAEKGKWVHSNANFSGFAWTMQSSGARWISADNYPSWHGSSGMIFFTNDVGPIISRNGGRSFEIGGRCPGTPWSTTPTGDMDPYDPNHLIAFFGSHARNFSLCRSIDGGKTWSIQPEIDLETRFNFLPYWSTNTARFLGKHPSTGSVVAVAERMMTLDAEAETPVWTRIFFEVGPNGVQQQAKMPELDTLSSTGNPGYFITAVGVADPKKGELPVLWASNHGGAQNIMIGRPYPQANGTEQPYLWSPVYSDWQFSMRQMAADPHDASRIYFAPYIDKDLNNSNKSLSPRDRVLDNELWLARLTVGANPEVVNFKSDKIEKIQLVGRELPEQLVDVPPHGFQSVSAIAPDPIEKDVVFIGLASSGSSNVYRVRFPNSTNRRIEITDLSMNLSRDSITSLSVRPSDGALFVGTHFGTWYLSRKHFPD